MIDDFKKKGFGLLKNITVACLNSFIDQFLKETSGNIQRDIVVSTTPQKGELQAISGDFWFHTDGTFYEIPPQWIFIYLITDSSASNFELLPGDSINLQNIENEFFWGKNDQGIIAKIVTWHNNTRIYRYRKDYVASIIDENEKIDLDNSVAEAALNHTISIRDFNPGDCLIINNWKFLHRRTQLNGERTIRRIWTS